MRGTVTVLALKFMIYSRIIVAEEQNERKKKQVYVRSMDQVFLWNSGLIMLNIRIDESCTRRKCLLMFGSGKAYFMI